MKRKRAAFCLLLILITASLRPAGADGSIVSLTGEALDATTIAVDWLCTDKADPAFTVTARVEGTDRSSQWVTYRNYYAVNHVAPETTYVISVSSATTQSVTITTPAADDFIEYSYRLLDTGLYQTAAGKKSDYTAVTALNSQTLADTLDTFDYHFMFQFRLTASARQKAFNFELMLRLPNGDSYALSDILWYGVRSKTYTEYYPFTALLSQVLADYGAFPVGEYTLSAYCNDDFAADYTFQME